MSLGVTRSSGELIEYLPLHYFKRGAEMNEQDLIKLKSDCEVYKSKIDKLEVEHAELAERVNKLEAKSEKTDFQYEQIMKMLDKLTEQTIPELSKEIQAIKNKPAERYNAAVLSIITTTIGGIIGYVLCKLFT